MFKFLRALRAFFVSSFLSGIIGGVVFVFYVLISSLFVKWHKDIGQEDYQIVLVVGCVLEVLLTYFVAAIMVFVTSVLPERYFETHKPTDLSRAYLPLMLVIYIPVFIATYFLFESVSIVAYLSVPYLFSVTLTLYYFNKHMVESYPLNRTDSDNKGIEPTTA